MSGSSAPASGFGHMVFFTLKDAAPAAQTRLVEACKQYLSQHPGTLHFSVGILSDTNREVVDRAYHVALHLIFDSRAAHDAYQEAASHHRFIAEQRDNWAQVRVFDSDLTA